MNVLSFWPRSLQSQIRTNYSLSPLTSFRVGGRADYFFSPKSKKELKHFVYICRNEEIPLYVIGGGANLLIPDHGVRGAVLDLSYFNKLGSQGSCLQAQAGVKIPNAIRYSIIAGLSGLENLAGIPGRIGGAFAMNAGGRYGSISEWVQSALVLTSDNEFETLPKSSFEFNYRHTKMEKMILIEVLFKLEKEESSHIRKRAAEIMREKIKVQPYEYPSAGCIFKNPSDEGRSAGKLLEMAQLKGFTIGDAQISEKHANFIVNRGQANSRDILRLIEYSQKRIYEQFGIQLQTEIKQWAA